MARPGLVGGQYRPLTEVQIKQIHQASLNVLERTGVHVEHEEALALYRQGGARTDGQRAYISATMVEQALEKAPSRVLLAGRDPGQDVVLEGKRVYAGTGGSPTMVLDPGADTIRPGTLQDLADLARLADALMGGTAPITMASGLAMSLAKILSSLVVHQLKRPGAPLVLGAGLHHMDMRATQICYASPEFQLTKAAIAELGRWYGLPTWGYAGCSDAKVLDEQAALETMLSVMAAKFSGANLVHDVGYMESGLTCSFEMIVLTDELAALMDHFMGGIEVSEDTLMLDELHRVGPGGHFLDTEQTLSRFRDFWYPGLLDRSIRPQWLADGVTTLGQRLSARVREIIAEHRPKPLEAEKKRQVQEILAQVKT